MKSRKFCFAIVTVSTLAFSWLVTGASSRAAIVVSGVTNGNTAPVIDSSFGTLEFALNLGNGGVLVRDGISFSNVNVTGGANVNFFASAPFSVDGTTVSAWNQANLGGDALFNTEAWSGGGSELTVTITGLDAGKNYQAQFLHGEPRNLTYNNGTIKVEDSLANTDTDSLTFGPNGSGNQFAIVTVEASGSTSLSYTMPNAGRGPSVAGIVLHSTIVPEPHSMIIMIVGLTITGFVRRRRNTARNA